MTKPSILLFLLVWALIFSLAMFIPVHGARLSGLDDDDDDILDKERSKFESQVTAEGIEFSSEFERPGFHDQLRFKLKCQEDSGSKLEFQYEREKNGTDTMFSFRFRVYEIIEYLEKSSPANGFTPDTDTVISRYRIGRNSSWTMPYLGTVSFEGVTVNKGEILTNDGVFRLVVYSSAQGFNYTNGLHVSATSLKFDIDIHNYQYQAASGSSLALRTAILYREKEEDVEDYESDEDQENERIVVRDAGANVAGRFEWMKSVTANNQQEQVFVTKQSSTDCGEDRESQGQGCKHVYFSFPGDNTLDFSWDPMIGLSSAGTLAVSTLSSILLALVALLLAFTN